VINEAKLFVYILIDGECILLFREDGKITIIKKNEMSISLTKATKESTSQERIFLKID
jgi:hypothetical protein